MASGDAAVIVVKDRTPLLDGTKKAPRPHLPALDTVRFFLISYIVVGHFIQVATTNVLLLRLFCQINVVVGAFFVISGYMAGYTGTEMGKLEASPRIQPASAYIISRIMGYYPLHFLVSLLFTPMFVFVDMTFNNSAVAAANGFMNFALLQAWFPAHAEIWNAPMWFLSAMTFATLALPAALAAIARLPKRGLWQCLAVLSLTLLVARVAYSYDLDCWTILEGRPASPHPNPYAWNVLRFHPAYALVEILMGVVAVRFVMLDEDPTGPSALSPVPPLLGMVGVIVARAYDVLPLNDPLTRSLLFIPLFITFIVCLHRQTIYGSGAYRLSSILSWGPLTYLGGISFPIFVVHGPLGQLFYKKVVAKKVFTSLWAEFGITAWPAWFFFVYLGLVLASAVVLQHGFLNQKCVRDATASLTKTLSGWFK